MASYTTNLNLLKKDPVADASDTFNITTMLNENWDKIDAAMGAARAAEPYSAAKTYAVGDYCTRNGALFKCAVAITTPEVWTAGHWTATSVAAELLAIIASLSNKADKACALPSGTDLNNVTDPNEYVCEFDDSYLNFPVVTNAYSLSVHKITSYALYQIFRPFHVDTIYFRRKYSDGWHDWLQIATSTPPTEYDLPLSSGWSAARLKYLKTQDGMVTLDGYEITSGSTGTGAWKIATLPAGHRPGNAVFAVVSNYTTGAMTTVSELIIDQDGNVFLHRTDTSATKHAVCVTFKAVT